MKKPRKTSKRHISLPPVYAAIKAFKKAVAKTNMPTIDLESELAEWFPTHANAVLEAFTSLGKKISMRGDLPNFPENFIGFFHPLILICLGSIIQEKLGTDRLDLSTIYDSVILQKIFEHSLSLSFASIAYKRVCDALTDSGPKALEQDFKESLKALRNGVQLFESMLHDGYNKHPLFAVIRESDLFIKLQKNRIVPIIAQSVT